MSVENSAEELLIYHVNCNDILYRLQQYMLYICIYIYIEREREREREREKDRVEREREREKQHLSTAKFVLRENIGNGQLVLQLLTR
jgi:hypothetical protein